MLLALRPCTAETQSTVCCWYLLLTLSFEWVSLSVKCASISLGVSKWVLSWNSCVSDVELTGSFPARAMQISRVAWESLKDAQQNLSTMFDNVSCVKAHTHRKLPGQCKSAESLESPLRMCNKIYPQFLRSKRIVLIKKGIGQTQHFKINICAAKGS